MGTVRVQFHAAAADVIAWAIAWANEHDLNIAFERFEPEHRVTTELTAGTPENPMVVDRVGLRALPFLLGAQTAQEFAALNPGTFWMTPGRITADGLRETLIGASTEDARELRRWKRLIQDARRTMHRDATVRSGLTGLARHMPKHLHSTGAHSLAAEGVPMLAIVGANEFWFDDLRQLS
jgi:hypothetical protein